MEFYGFSQCGEMFRKLSSHGQDPATNGQRKVGFEEDIPPFLLRQIRPVIRKHINIIPHWCTELLISWREAPTEDPELGVERPFECRPITRYRRAVIWAAPPAAGLSRPRRTEALLHEMCHLQLAPLQRQIEALLPENDALERTVVDQIEQTIEGMVQAYLMKDDANASFLRALARGSVNEHDLPPLGDGAAGSGIAECAAKENGRSKGGQAPKQNGAQETGLPSKTHRTMEVPSRLR